MPHCSPEATVRSSSLLHRIKGNLKMNEVVDVRCPRGKYNHLTCFPT